MIQNVGIIVNTVKDTDLGVTTTLVQQLTQQGFECFAAVQAQGCKYMPDIAQLCCYSDVIIVLGGDGTILKALQHVVHANKPILAVNLGTVGFLSGVEPNAIKDIALNLRQGSYNIISKCLLSVCYNSTKSIALNEVVVCNHNRSNTVELDVEIDNTLVDTLQGDGVIVCTPSGSTAYALSAGGAVLSPQINVLQMVPLCAHSLHNMPVVFSDHSVVTIKVLRGSCVALADGQTIHSVPEGSTVTVAKSPLVANFLSFGEVNFYDRLYRKLNKRA